MTEVILRRRQGRAGEVGLFPVDDEGSDLLAKIRDGRDVGADVVQRRNPRHHRLFFAILKFVKMHSPVMADVEIEDIKDAVKLATGYVRRFVDVDTGRVAYVTRSIAWGAMDQTEFNAFFDAACNVIATRWMPEGTTPDDVRRELIEMVDGPHALGSRVA
ncbi:DUF1367 family protein [Xanthobacteraceae bacterium Astr-EGSB]|uniref:hypothetical protein n=1 Tax=Astrobacterium formosum TaxID=3069710 RepID=UPI0027B343A4|nr:DUF1367 family protein [Xanthobacteraceae bacterium Astr-EGSB]